VLALRGELVVCSPDSIPWFEKSILVTIAKVLNISSYLTCNFSCEEMPFLKILIRMIGLMKYSCVYRVKDTTFDLSHCTVWFW
jgi:hypothetical protein